MEFSFSLVEVTFISKKKRKSFKSLFESGSGLYGVNVKGETVPHCGANEGEGCFFKSLSVCRWHTETAFQLAEDSSKTRKVSFIKHSSVHSFL